MKAVILAAGFGSRLGTHTKQIPKAAIEVASRPLIVRTVLFAQQIGVRDIVVIGGYKKDVLWKILDGMDVIKIDNLDFKKGNLYTLATAFDYLNDDIILMNIDHLYPSHLARMISELDSGIWAVSDFDRPLYQDDMKIRVEKNKDDKMTITAISKELDEYDGGYCGMTVVRGADSVKKYKNAMENVLRHGRNQAVVEDILEELVHANSPPKVLDISGVRWLEIDTQEDLANAERILRMKPHFLS